jgi:uncharacterized protein (TIGR00369 family)
MTDVSSAPQATATLLDRMGIVLLEVGPDRAVGTMPVAGNTQPHGLLHGGASAVLAETLGSVAANVHAGQGRVAVGIELNITHHRSARSGIVTGVATAVHLGGTVATYDIVVEDSDGHRLATARLTCLLIADVRG